MKITGVAPVLVEVRLEDKMLLVERNAKLIVNDNSLNFESQGQHKTFDFQDKTAAILALLTISEVLKDTTRDGVIINNDGSKFLDYKCGW